MKLRWSVTMASFLFLMLFSLGVKESKLTQQVAKVETSSRTTDTELESVIDLISDLDSTLALIREMPDESWGRNFFKPATKRKIVEIEDTEQQKEKPLPVVTTIVVNKDKSYAIIDNQIVRIGDMVKEMKVVKIEMGKVTLRHGEQTIVITMD